MPKFSANLGFLWQDRDLPGRIHAAAKAGFSAVECHFPYDTEPQAVRDALRQAGLPMLALNTHPGNLEKGEFGLCALPGEQARARQAIDQAIDYAGQIDAAGIHVMAGLSGDGAESINCFVDNLVYAGKQAVRQQIDILIEPINRIDKPGYALHRIHQACDIIDTLESGHGVSNVRLMFDCYHVQMGEGNLLDRLKQALPQVGHIQIAAVPGRGEPDKGEINYAWLFEQFDAMGYRGYVGAEYIPAIDTDSGLDWFAPYRNHRRPD